MSKTDFYRLIPDLQSWGDLNGHPYAPDAWLCGVGGFDHAIAYTTIFWPDLIEYDGCVFIDSAPDADNYASWFKRTAGEKHRIEAVLNHVHLVDLFAKDTATLEQLVYLGERVSQMWQAKAESEFPERVFVAEFYRGDKENLADYQVTLFQNTVDNS